MRPRRPWLTRGRFRDVNPRLLTRLLELAGHGQGRASLGFGPPARRYSAALGVPAPAWRIVAADASRPMLEFPAARSARAPAIPHPLAPADAKALPFASAAFDVIFSNSILHHIAETERFWREVRRLARPEACFFFPRPARPASAELRA